MYMSVMRSRVSVSVSSGVGERVSSWQTRFLPRALRGMEILPPVSDLPYDNWLCVRRVFQSWRLHICHCTLTRLCDLYVQHKHITTMQGSLCSWPSTHTPLLSHSCPPCLVPESVCACRGEGSAQQAAHTMEDSAAQKGVARLGDTHQAEQINPADQEHTHCHSCDQVSNHGNDMLP